MLLSHVSGLVDSFATLLEVTTEGDASMTLDEFTRAYALEGGSLYDVGLWGRAPGTEHSYCNAGYGVIGAVIEGAGGATFPAQTEAGLFGPLAMDGAGWLLSDIDMSRVATPYGYNGRSYSPLPHNGFAYYPATSLRISATGLARFAQMLLGGGQLDGVRVLEPESVDEMLRVQYPALDDDQALGFFSRRFGGRTYIGHSGSTFGASTQLLLEPDRSFAMLLITNSDAHIRARVPATREGREAMNAIIVRMSEEARR